MRLSVETKSIYRYGFGTNEVESHLCVSLVATHQNVLIESFPKCPQNVLNYQSHHDARYGALVNNKPAAV